MIVLRSVFKYTSILVFIVDVQVYIPTSSEWRSLSPISLLAFFVLVCLMIAILTAVKWTHKAVLICIPLMAKVVEHFKNVWGLLTFPPPVCLPPSSLSFVSVDNIRPWEGPIGHPFLSGFHSLVAIFFYCKVYQACLSCGYVNLCGDLLLLLTIASIYI